MAFFLIVPSVMIVSIVLVHALAKRLGLRIYYTTLIATAVLSFAAVYATSLIAPAVGRNFLLRLGLIISAGSLIAVLLNRFLLKRQREEEERFTEEVKAAYEAEKKKESLPAEEKLDLNESEDPFATSRYNEPVDTPTDDKADKPVKKKTRAEEIDELFATLTIDVEPGKSSRSEKTVEPGKSRSEKTVEPGKSSRSEKTVEPGKSSRAEKVVEPGKSSRAEKIVEPSKSSRAEKVVEPGKSSRAEKIVEPGKSSRAEKIVEPGKSSRAEKVVEPGKSSRAEKVVESGKSSRAERIVEPGKSSRAEKTVEPKKSRTRAEEIDELFKSSGSAKEFPLEKVFQPLQEVKPEEADKPIKLEKKADPVDNFPLQEVFKPLQEVKPKEADKPVKPVAKPSRAELFPLQEVFTPLSTLNLNKIEQITQEEKNSPTKSDDDEKFSTLDEILDRAYSERSKGHVWQAIELYKKALDRYRSDEYAPFVAIDLGNLYKENALYSKAVKVYEDALTLPPVRRNAEIKKEFATNLEYLRVVRDVLTRHRATSTPFDKLPKEILQEVDTEFNKVLNTFGG